jgi:hypothetical protein
MSLSKFAAITQSYKVRGFCLSQDTSVFYRRKLSY